MEGVGELVLLLVSSTPTPLMHLLCVCTSWHLMDAIVGCTSLHLNIVLSIAQRLILAISVACWENVNVNPLLSFVGYEPATRQVD